MYTYMDVLSEINLIIIIIITNDKYTTRQHVQHINLCSRDTASRDNAFRSGLLVTPTTVSKKCLVVDVYTEYVPVLHLFSNPKWYMKTSFDCLYAIILIGIMYAV